MVSRPKLPLPTLTVDPESLVTPRFPRHKTVEYLSCGQMDSWGLMQMTPSLGRQTMLSDPPSFCRAPLSAA